ncbi:PREDICTED: uncharacterized protein LOC108371850 [Rhagoletis zephyria]|uniref:uncharacterized protein LOC108371850 n=1 Tax=Rhagoletis zephyria TaxID=28612 RepID=UPI0008113D9D|nr:PREDICTED: uncharacterized protein LOC108371850 [Rhagoletis zephyria]
MVTATPRLRREIKLPKFDGKYAEFPKFIALFTKMVHHGESLDDCERFLILKESLGARPLAAIADFDETEKNYPKALQRLKDCFDKKNLIFEEHISALLELLRAAKASAEHLRKVIDTTNARLNAMLSLGTYENIANALIIFLVMEKLDSESQAKWEEAEEDYTKLASCVECSAVLARRCQTLEAREVKTDRMEVRHNVTKEISKDFKSKHMKSRRTASLAVERVNCGVCRKDDHNVLNCPKFTRMTPSERYSVVRGARLCIVCLKKGHWFKQCLAAKYSVCNQPHHDLLHRQVDVATGSSGANAKEQHVAGASESSALCTSWKTSTAIEVLLETVVILQKDASGNYHQARAIFGLTSTSSV